MLRFFYVTIFSIFAFTAVNAQTNNTPSKTVQFHTFTGKITGSKVRLRTGSDLDSSIVKQLNKNDLVLVMKDADDFWGVRPPANVKAYIFRSYVLENTIEANRVNLRLLPNLDSPVIGQMKNGDKIQGAVCKEDHKWMEILCPDNVYFYIAKEYVTYAGNDQYYAKMQTKKDEAEKLINSAYFITQSECKKPFDEMNPQEAVDQFDALIKGYSEFPEFIQQAKEGLALLQDNYLQKKIAYLEAKANISQNEQEDLLTAIEKASNSAANADIKPLATYNKTKTKNLSDKMKFYEPVEESLFLTWTTFHPEKKLDEFYKEQEINATTITGVVEGYNQAIKNKPGNYIVKSDNNAISYLYSTKVNLDKYVGQKVKLKVSPRPNNNFAFPAYFVNAIE